MTSQGPKRRSPEQTNAQYDGPKVDPNTPFMEAGSSGGLGWGTTGVGGYEPVLVRILRSLARRRDNKGDG